MDNQVLWDKAMKKLKIDRGMFSVDDIFRIVKLEHHEHSLSMGIIEQIKRDVGLYPKYDAIAMWVGDGGLIECEPKFITELVKMFGIEE